MANRIAREVGEAALVRHHTPIHVKPSRPNLLVDIAKRLQRLQTKRAKLRREMKSVDADIRLTKRELKAIAAAIGRGE